MDIHHIYCPACSRNVPPEIIARPEQIADKIMPLLTVSARGWEPGKEICTDCLGRFFHVYDELMATFPQFNLEELKVLPTPMRLDAPGELRGRGVTIAFLDSGFYAHPDLTLPRNRILKYVNVVERTRPTDLKKPQPSSWH